MSKLVEVPDYIDEELINDISTLNERQMHVLKLLIAVAKHSNGDISIDTLGESISEFSAYHFSEC